MHLKCLRDRVYWMLGENQNFVFMSELSQLLVFNIIVKNLKSTEAWGWIIISLNSS